MGICRIHGGPGKHQSASRFRSGTKPSNRKTKSSEELSNEVPKKSESYDRADQTKHASVDMENLPFLDASPFLDPRSYCRRSAVQSGSVSRNGTDAARRLINGRQQFLWTLKRKLGNATSLTPYQLAGHGVPRQLLQDHVEFGYALLSLYNQAEECAFNGTGSCDIERYVQMHQSSILEFLELTFREAFECWELMGQAIHIRGPAVTFNLRSSSIVWNCILR